jgi:hypothetical protein
VDEIPILSSVSHLESILILMTGRILTFLPTEESVRELCQTFGLLQETENLFQWGKLLGVNQAPVGVIDVFPKFLHSTICRNEFDLETLESVNSFKATFCTVRHVNGVLVPNRDPRG